jgi:hypothetical protein
MFNSSILDVAIGLVFLFQRGPVRERNQRVHCVSVEARHNTLLDGSRVAERPDGRSSSRTSTTTR